MTGRTVLGLVRILLASTITRIRAGAARRRCVLCACQEQAKSNRGMSLAEQKPIAVVDDDPDMLQSVEMLLSSYGYDTKLFGSAEEILSVFPTLEAACLIVDIQLGGISGLELVRALCAEGFSLPVIFITGSRDERHRRQALELGCVAFLLKPFSEEQLIETVKKATGASN
jgi:FixJ family two-component response regulator